MFSRFFILYSGCNLFPETLFVVPRYAYVGLCPTGREPLPSLQGLITKVRIIGTVITGLEKFELFEEDSVGNGGGLDESASSDEENFTRRDSRKSKKLDPYQL